MTEERSTRDKEFDELWEKGEKVKIMRPASGKKTSVFSIKIDRELLRLLVERARELGIGPSTLARELIEEGLMARGEELPLSHVCEILQTRIGLLEAQAKQDS